MNTALIWLVKIGQIAVLLCIVHSNAFADVAATLKVPATEIFQSITATAITGAPVLFMVEQQYQSGFDHSVAVVVRCMGDRQAVTRQALWAGGLILDEHVQGCLQSDKMTISVSNDWLR